MHPTASEGAFFYVTGVEGGNAVFSVDPRKGVSRTIPTEFTHGGEGTGEQRIDMDSAAKSPAVAEQPLSDKVG